MTDQMGPTDPEDQPPVLSDGFVFLRPPVPADSIDITEACQDREIVRWTTVPSPYVLQDALTWISQHQAGPNWWRGPTWAITQGDSRWGGSIDLRLDGAGGAEVGYLVAPWLRGNRAATRALRLVCAWAFMSAGVKVVRWYAHVGNEASRAVATNVGFHIHREVLRQGLVHDGARVDGWVGDLLPGEVQDNGARRSPFTGPSLTPRERQVLDQLATGKSNRAISQILGISENTVKNHVRKILEKLQATSRVDAVVRGVQEGLTTLP